MPRVAEKLLMFVPHLWGEVERFRKFCGETYKFNERDQRALSGVGAHFEKSLKLQSLAVKLKPGLAIDAQQLEDNGHTPAENAAELATVIEAAFLELYASIDCTAKILRAIYAPGTRGFKESTRTLFQNPDKLTGTFPEIFKTAIRKAGWYARLLHLRDELTHYSTGSVYGERDTDKVSYIHMGLKEDAKPLILPDVFASLDELTASVNAFLGYIFHHLNATLSDTPVFQLCGMVEGRALHRYVDPSKPLDFNSGRCGAWAWFELPENPTCPFKEFCGAYLDKEPPKGWETTPAAKAEVGTDPSQ